MKKAFLLALSLLGASSMWAQTSPYTGSEVAAGDFFLYNVETGLWLQNNEKNTGDWNTRGATGTYGFEFGISALDGGWKLDPKFGHNQSMNASNFYLDTSDGVTTWTIEPKTVNGVTNAYTIKSGDQILGLDDNDNLAMGTDAKSTWQLVTRAERIEYLEANASEQNPLDATFLIMDPSFANENERRNAWQWSRDGGNLDDVRWFWNRRSYAVWNTNSFKISQLIENIPNGTYKLTVKGYYRDGDRDEVINRRAAGTEKILGKYFINADKANFMSILDGASQTWVDGLFFYPAADANAPYGHYPDNADGFNRIFQDYPNAYLNAGVTSVVTTKSMTIGIEKLEANARDWLAFDDFRLTYMGSNIDVTAMVEALQKAIDEAEAWDASNTSTTLATALNAAITDAKGKLNSTDEEELSAATLAVNSALSAAQAVNVSVLKATAVLAEAEGVDVTAANDVIANATSAAEIDPALEALRTARRINAVDKQPDVFTGSAPEDGGQYYIYNIGAQRYLTGGVNYGTHAAVNFAAQIATLTKNGEGWRIHTNIRTNSDALNHNGYVDCPGDGDTWYLFEVAPGVYNISNTTTNTGATLLGYSGERRGNWWQVDTDNEGADLAINQWKFVSKAERDALLATASESNPVDATYYIHAAGFDHWLVEAQLAFPQTPWQITYPEGKGGNTNIGGWEPDFNFETWNAGNSKLFQELKGLAPGKYRLAAQAYYRHGGFEQAVEEINNTKDDGAILFATNGKGVTASTFIVPIVSERDKAPGYGRSSAIGRFPDDRNETAAQFFEFGLYKNVVNDVIIGADGTLTIGMEKFENNQGGEWVVVDNFRLTYLGPVEEQIDVTITDAKYATFVAPFEAAMPAGVTAATATLNGEEIVLTPVEGKVAAHTPVILSAEAAKDLQVSGYPTIAPAELKAGVLVGTYSDIPAPVGSYVLQNQNGKVGFFLVEDVTPTVTANHACLVAPAAGVKAYLLGDLETAIKALEAEGMKDAVIFNLAGQRVGKAVKGIYIVNGKKAVVK